MLEGSPAPLTFQQFSSFEHFFERCAQAGKMLNVKHFRVQFKRNVLRTSSMLTFRYFPILCIFSNFLDQEHVGVGGCSSYWDKPQGEKRVHSCIEKTSSTALTSFSCWSIFRRQSRWRKSNPLKEKSTRTKAHESTNGAHQAHARAHTHTHKLCNSLRQTRKTPQPNPPHHKVRLLSLCLC